MAGQALKKLLEMRDDPYARAKAWKEGTGGKVIGYFCCLSPEEIIHAAGALPVRITGRNKATSKSGAHLQSYCCSLARTGLDMALEKDLSFMDGTMFVHTCDTMMRLSDIWRLNAGFAIHGDVVLPVRFEGKSPRQYAHQELDHFRKKMEEYLGPVQDDALRESIKLYNRNRRLLAQIYSLRRQNPGILPYDQALWLVTSSALMEKGEHNELLQEVLADLEVSSPLRGEDQGEGDTPVPSPPGGEGQGEGDPKDTKLPLFGIGSVMDQWEFLQMVEEIGATLVDDDFCNGRRYFDTEAPEGADPLESIAARLWDRQACPCKYHPARDRAACLADRVVECGARGAIFWLFKFCEPHAFDYPPVKKALDEAGVPSINLEIEQGSVSIEQLRTRVEALVETIRGSQIE
jgi:benzoyl-CoA reductase subunit C